MTTAPAPVGAKIPNGTSGTQTIDSGVDITGFTPGQAWYKGFYWHSVRATGTNVDTITEKVRWWDGSGTELTPTSSTVNVNGTQPWQWYEAVHLPPTNAVRGRLNFTFTPGGTTFQHDIYVTAIRMSKTQFNSTLGAKSGVGGNLTGEVDGNGRPYVDFIQAGHFNKNLDNIGDGSTYGRPLLSRLSSGKPFIDFNESIHLNKSLASVDAAQNTKLTGIATNAGAVATPIASSNPTAFTFTGNRIDRSGPGTGNGWNASAYCLELMAETAVVQFQANVADSTLWMAGLTPTPTATIASSTDITTVNNYLLYHDGAGQISTYSGGSYTGAVATSKSDTAVFTIIYDGTRIRMYVDGILVKGVVVPSGQTYYFAFYPWQGAYVKNIRTGQYLPSDWSANVQNRPAELIDGRVAAGLSATNGYIDFSRTHISKILDNIPDGTTYGRPLLTRLSSGKPLIDFNESIHLNKSLASVDSAANTKLGGIAAGATVGGTWGVNISNAPLQKIYAGNLLDMTLWKSGQDFVGGSAYDQSADGTYWHYSGMGSHSGSNVITVNNVVGPSGTYEPLMTAVGAGTYGDGGLTVNIGNMEGYDPKKTYRQSVWVQATATGLNLPSYFGPQANNPATVYDLGSPGVADTNPYGWSGGSLGAVPCVAGKWYLMVGILHSSDYTGGYSGIAGIYDPATGNKIYNITEFKSAPGAAQNGFRFFWYTSTVGTLGYWAEPRMEELTVGAPSVQQILATVGADWTVNTQNRPVELTDGRVAAGLSATNGYIDFSRTHINKSLDNIPDGSTYGRPIATRLSSGKPFIDFNENIHLNQGALSKKNSVDPSTSDVLTTGSIPPTIPGQSFSYSSTTTSVTISWPTITVYRADGTTVTVTANSSYVITGLTANTSYKVYPYVVDTGGTTGTVSFVTAGTGTPVGSPANCFPQAGDAGAAANMYGRGHIPLNAFVVSTPASGTGGGTGGGLSCLHPDMIVGNYFAKELEVGYEIPGPNGPAKITHVTRKSHSKWIILYSCGVELAKVTPDHRFHRANGEEVRAYDIKLGDLLAAAGDLHIEVTGLELSFEVAQLVSIELEDPHLYYAGAIRLLCHNPKP